MHATILFRLLSSRLLSKNLKIKIYGIIVLLLFCMSVKLGFSYTKGRTFIEGF